MATQERPATHSAFFYGTLMSPPILRRVCAPLPPPRSSTNPNAPTQPERTTRAAILPDHRRHRVRHADYPAIVPVAADEESKVRGTYVTGLSDEDVRRLDVFEGNEYERRVVRVRCLRSTASGSTSDAQVKVKAGDAPVATGELEEAEEVEAQTYIWSAPVSRLEDEEWDFDEFCRSKMWRWAPGGAGEARGEYDGLDQSGRGDSAGGVAGNTGGEGNGTDGTGGRFVGGGFEEVVDKSAQVREEVLVGAV